MRIIVSCGDCNGIGIEVMVKSILGFDSNVHNSDEYDISIATNTETLDEYLSHFKFPARILGDSLQIGNRICQIIECKSYSPVEFGLETESAGRLAAEAVEIAVSKTINKEFDALVTMPISKSSVYKAGWKFPGHTEMLAARCGVENPMMILFSGSVRVALATIHIPIKDVPKQLNTKLIVEKIETLNKSLILDFDIEKPKIAVLGLNPHAGEDGSIGFEEKIIINPALKICKDSNIKAVGTFPADGFFAHGDYKNFDGIIAMYHDQGLIPLKLLANGGGVNFTAGLPMVRTSPDHGTAFAIAGKNIANPKSSIDAIEAAISIAENRKMSKT